MCAHTCYSALHTYTHTHTPHKIIHQYSSDIMTTASAALGKGGAGGWASDGGEGGRGGQGGLPPKVWAELEGKYVPLYQTLMHRIKHDFPPPPFGEAEAEEGGAGGVEGVVVHTARMVER